VLVHAVGKIAQSIRHGAHGNDGLAAHLRDDCVVDVGDGMAEFHLDQLDGLFYAPSDAARART
jgi:hypothetical protein